MRSAFDFAPFRRSTVGFDRLFDMLESGTAGNGGENYPPFDLIRTGENDYRIELAVAGFKPDEIDITAQQNVLIVSHGDFMWATRLVLERWSDEEFLEHDKDPGLTIYNCTVVHYSRVDPVTGRRRIPLRTVIKLNSWPYVEPGTQVTDEQWDYTLRYNSTGICEESADDFVSCWGDATSTAGSPARLGCSITGIWRPVTVRAVSSTSRTEEPTPVPRLKIS